MKLPIINKYHSINFCILLILIWAISCTMAYFVIQPPYAELWLPFLFISVISELVLPIFIFLSILEIILFKLKILKYEHLVVNIPSKIQKIIYVIAALSFVYYLWFKLYYEPILDKMMEFD